MTEAETVRPTGNMFDLWDKMMEPFEPEEREGDNPEEEHLDKEKEGDDEAISVEEEEGIEVKVWEMEKAPTKEEVAMHMVNHIMFRS